jgi:hypothetical protein
VITTAGLIWLKLRPRVGFHGLVNRLTGLLSGSSNTNFNRGLGLIPKKYYTHIINIRSDI